jgi:osmotically-inducible protein OsmY
VSHQGLRLEVTEELLWEPRVDDRSVAVSADEGAVTLRGTVGSLREKAEAASAARRVRGVTRVENELRVRILSDSSRDDAELRGAVLAALMLDSMIPSTVDVRIEDGRVTLTGTVGGQFQREEAELVASNVLGVIEVVDAIGLKPRAAHSDEPERSIQKAFQRRAGLNEAGLYAECLDGTAIIFGSVRSWGEHDAALAAAWSAPGVSVVDDRILVQSSP